jgi:hypothetical protein
MPSKRQATAATPSVGTETTEFSVDSQGTIERAGWVNGEKRSDYSFYDFGERWRTAPEALADAMEVCEPLSWEILSIRANIREAPARALKSGEPLATSGAGTHSADPADGVRQWLDDMTAEVYQKQIVPHIQRWMDASPDWDSEADYLAGETAREAAMRYFEAMSPDVLDALGVVIIEGEHPGSTYYAAELVRDIDDANRAAKAAGLPVRFVPAT